MPYYYPSELAVALRQQWPAHGFALPSVPLLTQFIAVAYQASLLQEEGRAVLAHLILVEEPLQTWRSPQASDYQLLAFTQPRPYDEQELRRLSPTVQRPSSWLAVRATSASPEELEISGMVLTTRPWDNPHDPDRPDHLPPALFVRINEPGGLAFFCGAQQVFVLQHGRIAGHGLPEFPQAWTKGHFQSTPLFQLTTDSAAAQATLTLTRQLAAYTTYRYLNQVRSRKHGGMVVLIPSQEAASPPEAATLLQHKYGVHPNETGQRYLALLAQIIAQCNALDITTWETYRSTSDGTLRLLQTELERYADLLADLMSVDGALVLNQEFEVVGFGTEIQVPAGTHPQVYRALDRDAVTTQAEPTNGGGTRHRAAYRLCQAAPDYLVIVVSQDGSVKYVRRQEERVVFWEQLLL